MNLANLEEVVAAEFCRRVAGARSRYFTVSARTFGVDTPRLLRAILEKLQRETGVAVIAGRRVYKNGKVTKYIIDAWAATELCSRLSKR